MRREQAVRQFETQRETAEYHAAMERWTSGDPNTCEAQLRGLVARNPKHADARRILRENERLLEGLVGGIAEEDSAQRAAQELTLLRKRFEEALVTLRRARFRGEDGERRTVGELPWYMFIGAPGSGKTTALLNAGLRFPLGDPRAGHTLQGVGGTRNCDWWFTDEAVLLDTAGRYTTQDSDREADAAAWLGFLDLLKRHRARQPLNGVIVTLSIADLVHWNGEELARYGAHVRERLAELQERLGVRLPVYVMVTKADLLAGFNEFFSELDSGGRAQVWGMTFDATEVPAAHALMARFQEEFGRLEGRLYATLPARLQEERDLQRRAALYRFPQQFRVTRPLVSPMVTKSPTRTGRSIRITRPDTKLAKISCKPKPKPTLMAATSHCTLDQPTPKRAQAAMAPTTVSA